MSKLTFDSSMFDGADDAEVMAGGGGARPVAGHYLARVNAFKAGSGHNGDFYAFELTILADYGDGDNPTYGTLYKPENMPEGKDAWDEAPEARNKAGQEVSMARTMPSDKTKKSYWFSDLKKALAAMTGVSAESIGKEQITRILQGSLVNGLFVEMRNPVKKLKNGKPFATINFVRTLEPSEFANVLSEKVIANQFGGGDLDKGKAALAALIEAEDE